MATKKEHLAQEVAKAVGAGKAVALETVDFGDPNRPKTCLEVDFPILPINQIASIEAASGGSKKPIYQLSKWWARRQSCVFRSMLIAAATKAPDDPAHAAKLVWDNYYANHQKKGAFKHLKVADIFMGGGTTLVEGTRLGMQMLGNDLNPVAWFVVKQEFAKVDRDEVMRLVADIEAEIKPQLLPFYYCDGPNGEKGKWMQKSTGKVMGPDFDPLSLKPEYRKDYSYEGPELIYTFWAKHVTCQVTGCGHRTPLMSSPVIANKTLSSNYWQCHCQKCGLDFDVEESPTRIAPDVHLHVSSKEKPFTILDPTHLTKCPQCGHQQDNHFGKKSSKRVKLSLLILPGYLKGSPSIDGSGNRYGGAAQDDASSTIAWNKLRAEASQFIEVRGELPEVLNCPVSGEQFFTDERGGTIPKKSNFSCARCGAMQDVLDSTSKTQRAAPYHPLLIQAFSPQRRRSGAQYDGRYFAANGNALALAAAEREWEIRKDTDLAAYWPREELPYGLEADFWSVRRHGFTHWYTMFNHRQLLGLAILSKAIHGKRGSYSEGAIDLVIAAFQQ